MTAIKFVRKDPAKDKGGYPEYPYYFSYDRLGASSMSQEDAEQLLRDIAKELGYEITKQSTFKLEEQSKSDISETWTLTPYNSDIANIKERLEKLEQRATRQGETITRIFTSIGFSPDIKQRIERLEDHVYGECDHI
jgi:hypothetical protein